MKKVVFAGVTLSALVTVPVVAQAPRAGQMQSLTRAIVETRVQKQFTRIDADRDGFVTQAEAQAAVKPRPQPIHMRGHLFSLLDANKDGQITVAEAQGAGTRASAARDDARPDPSKRAARLIARLDANGDTIVTRAEFDARAARRADRAQSHGARKGARGVGLRGRMFTRLDSNKDGRISLAEATTAKLARFDRTDANRDGTVTREEIRSARETMRAQRRGGKG